LEHPGPCICSGYIGSTWYVVNWALRLNFARVLKSTGTNPTARVVETGVSRFPPQPTALVKRQDGCPADPHNISGYVGCILGTTTSVNTPTPAPAAAPPPVADSGCPIPDPNVRGGTVSCIPNSQRVPPPGEPTMIPLTGTVTGSDRYLPTVTITWTVSEVSVPTTLGLLALPTIIPV
jgi:hypothetical protein